MSVDYTNISWQCEPNFNSGQVFKPPTDAAEWWSSGQRLVTHIDHDYCFILMHEVLNPTDALIGR